MQHFSLALIIGRQQSSETLTGSLTNPSQVVYSLLSLCVRTTAVPAVNQSVGTGTGTSIFPSTLNATTNLLTKLYPPTVATASTICLSSRNLWRPSKMGCGTCTRLVMKSVNSIAALNSGVRLRRCSAEKARASRISRSCRTVRPALRPTGSCFNLPRREDRRDNYAII